MQIQLLRPHTREFSIALAAAMALLLGPVGHSAELPQVTVKYADLNVSTAAGAERLLHRIQGAARQVCGDPYGTKDLALWSIRHRCYSQAVARAVEDVKAQRLTEAYRASHSLARAN
jgi:UrcA family protein